MNDEGRVRGPARALLARYPLARKALVAVPALAAAGPFASISPGASGFPYLYRVLWVLLALVAIPLAFTKEVRTRLIPRLFTLLVVWWVIWTPITLQWSPTPRVGRTEILASVASLLGAWVVLIVTKGSSRSLRYLRAGFVAAFVMTLLVVLWEFVTGEHLPAITGVQEWFFSLYLVSGTFTNPNGLSNFLLVCVAVLVAQLAREVSVPHPRRALADAYELDQPLTPADDGAATASAFPRHTSRGARWRVCGLVALLAFAVYILMLTGSRAGMMVSTLLFLLGAAWCLAASPRRVVALALIGLAVAGPALSFTSLDRLRPPTALAKTQGEEPLSGHHVDTLTRQEMEADYAAADRMRLDLTKSGARSLADAPLIGNGAGSSMTKLEQDEEYGPGLDPKDRRIINLHNSFLEMGVNYGLIGLLPVILVNGGVLAFVLHPGRLARLWPDPNVLEALGVLLAVAVTSVIASSAVGDPTFWLFIAYAGAVAWNYADADRVARPVSPSPNGGGPAHPLGPTEPAEPKAQL